MWNVIVALALLLTEGTLVTETWAERIAVPYLQHSCGYTSVGSSLVVNASTCTDVSITSATVSGTNASILIRLDMMTYPRVMPPRVRVIAVSITNSLVTSGGSLVVVGFRDGGPVLYQEGNASIRVTMQIINVSFVNGALLFIGMLPPNSYVVIRQCSFSSNGADPLRLLQYAGLSMGVAASVVKVLCFDTLTLVAASTIDVVNCTFTTVNVSAVYFGGIVTVSSGSRLRFVNVTAWSGSSIVVYSFSSILVQDGSAVQIQGCNFTGGVDRSITLDAAVSVIRRSVLRISNSVLQVLSGSRSPLRFTNLATFSSASALIITQVSGIGSTGEPFYFPGGFVVNDSSWILMRNNTLTVTGAVNAVYSGPVNLSLSSTLSFANNNCTGNTMWSATTFNVATLSLLIERCNTLNGTSLSRIGLEVFSTASGGCTSCAVSLDCFGPLTVSAGSCGVTGPYVCPCTMGGVGAACLPIPVTTTLTTMKYFVWGNSSSASQSVTQHSASSLSAFQRSISDSVSNAGASRSHSISVSAASDSTLQTISPSRSGEQTETLSHRSNVSRTSSATLSVTRRSHSPSMSHHNASLSFRSFSCSITGSGPTASNPPVIFSLVPLSGSSSGGGDDGGGGSSFFFIPIPWMDVLAPSSSSSTATTTTTTTLPFRIVPSIASFSLPSHVTANSTMMNDTRIFMSSSCVVWSPPVAAKNESSAMTRIANALQNSSLTVVNQTTSSIMLLVAAALTSLNDDYNTLWQMTGSSNVSFRLYLNQTCVGSAHEFNAVAQNTSTIVVTFYTPPTSAPPPSTTAPLATQPAKVVVAQTITAVFGVVSDPVIAAQANRAGVSMLLVVCGVDDSPLPFYSHPFGNAFGEGMVRYYAGAVVMNALLVALVAVGQGVAGLLYWALWSRRRASWNEVLTFTRFPSMLAFPILFVQQPTVSAAMVSFVWGGAEYAYAGVVGILVSVVPFVIVYWWVVRAPRFGGTYVAEDPKKMRSNVASKFFFGTGMWHDVPGRPGFKQQSQFFFTDYVGGRHYFMLVEMGMNVACGIVVGLVAPSMCRSLLFVTAVLYTVFGAVGVVLRPFSSGFQLWYFVVVTCMQILGTAFSLAAVQFEVGEALDWAVKTNVATMYCLMAQVAIGLWPKQRRLRHFIAKLRRTLAAGYEETKEALLVEEMELLTEKVSGGSVDLLHCGKKHMGGDYSPPSAEDVELNIEHNHDSIVVTLEPEQQEPEQESPRVVADSFASEERLFLASSSLLATTGVQFANAEAALAALHSKEARIRELAQKVAAFITHQYSPGGAADADDGFVSAEQEKASVVSHSSILNVCLERLSLSGIWEEEESGSELMSFNDTFRFGMMSLARSGCFEATALCTLLFDGNVTERSTTPCVVTVHTQQPLEVEVSSSEGRSIIVAGEERNSRGRSPPLLLALEL